MRPGSQLTAPGGSRRFFLSPPSGPCPGDGRFLVLHGARSQRLPGLTLRDCCMPGCQGVGLTAVPEWRPWAAGSGQEEQSAVKELHSDGNLTVLGHTLLSSHPIQLDFHFRLGKRKLVHWHGTLSSQKLFLDTPNWVLNQGTKESLTAVLEFVEQQTDVKYVFLNFEKTRTDRGELLRAFAYMGFEVVRAGHPSVPSWADTIFMAYTLERDSPSSKAAENVSQAESGQANGQQSLP
uniref:Ornithine decarboxylase antizyme 3 n=1 Tax=Geotrypetes seraphini TaxID=260995 RepID=A0A6P8PDQ1_GEOSA|nr:ornithine decarboxylase antizyme 3 [Geotrypetes seraphini]